MAKNVISFKHLPPQQQKNELLRLKILSGADYGLSYVIIGSSVTFGRAEDCDVVMGDIKASRQHAKLVLKNKGWYLVDLGSANGVFFKNKKISEVLLNLEDVFTIGETQYQIFNPFFEFQKNLARALGSNKKVVSPFLIIVSVLGVCAIIFLGNHPSAVKDKNLSSLGNEKSLQLLEEKVSSVLKENKQVAQQHSQEAFILKDGLREYYSGNYARARSQFATVLQIYPHHEVASLYYQKSIKSIEDSIQYHMDLGKKTFDAGKLRSSKGHFESVQRFLKGVPSDPRWKEAEQYLEKVKLEEHQAL